MNIELQLCIPKFNYTELQQTDYDYVCMYIMSFSRRNTFHILFFYYLVCEAIGTATTPGLLCQPRVIVKMIVEKQMECRLAGETEVLGENCPSATFVHHKVTLDQTRV
jgi:hypothetical protein